MRRVLPTGIVGLALLAAALATISGTALAYFTTTGAGTASKELSKLSAPSISTATPAAGGTVTLSWTAVTPPGTGTVTYSVSRDGGAPAGNCPTSASPAAVTSCIDGGLAVGTHSYVVTAKWHSWSAASGASTAKITVGPADHFVLAAASTAPTAGAADNLTITAKDEDESTVTTYTGSHSLVFSGASSSPGGNAPTVSNGSGTAIAFGTATPLTFAAGVATVTSTKNGVMRLYRSGAASIGASEGSIGTATPLVVAVAPAAASKLVLGAASTTPAAGAADSLTVTAQDTYGNTASAYTGSRNLTFSGASASPGGNVPTVSNSAGTATAFGSATALDFTAGMSAVSGAANGVLTLYKGGSTNVKVSDGSISSANLALTVSVGTTSRFVLGAASTTPTAGASDNLTTTAQDAYGNTTTSYAGSHNLTFSGSSASPNGTLPTVVNSAGTAISFGSATAINFSSGVASVSSSKNGVMKLNRAGVASITVSEGSISNPTPLAVTVSPGSATKLAFSNLSISAGTLGSTCLFTCSVTGLGNGGTIVAKINVADSLGNTVSSIGSGHAVTVTANGGTIGGGSLSLPASEAAESTTQFTYTAPASGAYSNTITAATSAGTVYTSATATANK